MEAELTANDIQAKIFHEVWPATDGWADDIEGDRVALAMLQWQARGPSGGRARQRLEMWYPHFSGSLPQTTTSVILRPGGIRTMVRTTGGPLDRVHLSFSKNTMARILNRERLGSPADLQLGLRLGGPRTPVAQILTSAAREIRRPSLGSSAKLEALGILAIVEVARMFEMAVDCDDHQPVENKHVALVRERLEDCTSPMPNVTALAQLCGMSPRNLLRQFKAATGQPLIDEIRQSRLRNACFLLASTTLPLKEIAFRLDFASPSSFGEAFRNETGTTPRKYRQDRHNFAPSANRLLS